jgi:hypothetical protein
VAHATAMAPASVVFPGQRALAGLEPREPRVASLFGHHGAPVACAWRHERLADVRPAELGRDAPEEPSGLLGAHLRRPAPGAPRQPRRHVPRKLRPAGAPAHEFDGGSLATHNERRHGAMIRQRDDTAVPHVPPNSGPSASGASCLATA